MAAALGATAALLVGRRLARECVARRIAGKGRFREIDGTGDREW